MRYLFFSIVVLFMCERGGGGWGVGVGRRKQKMKKGGIRRKNTTAKTIKRDTRNKLINIT